MEESRELYVVVMYRWGDVENHSYVLGVYDSLKVAEFEGQKQRDYRGGKYDPKIYITLLNKTIGPKPK